MPISTTRQAAAFPEVAVIRKGAPKGRMMKNGREIETLGADLQNKFRVVFHPGVDQTLVDGFTTAYGSQQPTAIRAVLPFRQALANWEAWNEAYSAGRLIARADGDHYIVKRSPTSGEYEVIGGEPFTPWHPGDFIAYEKGGREYTLKFKPTGRLRLFLPYTIQETATRIVHFTLKTTSYYDCLNIEANLLAVQGIADVLNGGNCAGVPILITRRETDISRSMADGSAQRVKKWLIYIEVDPEWTATMMNRLRLLAAGGVTPALPTGPLQTLTVTDRPGLPTIEEDEEDEDDQPEPETEPQPADAIDGHFAPVSTETPAPSTPPAAGGRSTRPYQPETLRKGMRAREQANASRQASPKQRSLLRLLLEKCFAPAAESATMRKELTRYLFDVWSSEDLTGPQILALLDWLKPVKDSGGDMIPSPLAAGEAVTAYRQALIERGQLEIPF